MRKFNWVFAIHEDEVYAQLMVDGVPKTDGLFPSRRRARRIMQLLATNPNNDISEMEADLERLGLCEDKTSLPRILVCRCGTHFWIIDADGARFPIPGYSKQALRGIANYLLQSQRVFEDQHAHLLQWIHKLPLQDQVTLADAKADELMAAAGELANITGEAVRSIAHNWCALSVAGMSRSEPGEA